MDQILEKLFESVPKVRLLRLFMRNAGDLLSLQEVIKKTQLRSQVVKNEIKKLQKLSVIKTRVIKVDGNVTKRKNSNKKQTKTVLKKKRQRVYYVDPQFELLPELQNLIAKGTTTSRKKISSNIKGLNGRVKLVIISGIFLNNERARTDLLVVGEGIKKAKFDQFLNRTESELGKSLRYTLMDTDEFKYRLDMYDRFLRDILEYPHEKLVNKLNL